MDRSMKVMFGMMTVAICMLAFTMMGNQSQQAFAGNYVDDRDRIDEPTIVSFRVTPLVGGQVGGDYGTPSIVLLWRMWSSGLVEVNFVGNETLLNWGAVDPVNYRQVFEWFDSLQDGWIVVEDSVAGYACAGDTDGNREVGVDDLLTLLADWGQCEEDPPTNLAPDPDLS